MDSGFDEMIKKEFIYSIRGFSPPAKGDNNMGAWGFATKINGKVADELFKTILSEEEYETIQKIGRLIIEGYKFDSKFIRPYDFVKNKDGKLTFLLHCCDVPGNACSLDLERVDLSQENPHIKPWLEYIPHNVDTMPQAAALLSLWLKWADAARGSIK